MKGATAPRTALITGSTGFIGGHVVSRLIDAGCRAACLVRVTSVVDALRSSGAEMIVGDATDHQSLERALADSQPEVVFHLAGVVRAWRRAEFMRVNAGGVEAVASACAQSSKPPVLVVVSSLAAAGPCRGSPRSESDAPSPVSAYGRSKLAGEIAAAKFARELPLTIVRPPIVFGPGDRGVLEIMRPISRWGVHMVPGRGEFRLSLVHVDDLVEAVLGAAVRGERMSGENDSGRGVYFIAGDEHPTYGDLGRMIADALGRERVRIVGMPPLMARVAGLGGDVLARYRRRRSWINSDKVTEALAGSWMCDSRKAREHFDWRPALPLANRLRETVQWYRSAGWL